jgi:hypothetical protein
MLPLVPGDELLAPKRNCKVINIWNSVQQLQPAMTYFQPCHKESTWGQNDDAGSFKRAMVILIQPNIIKLCGTNTFYSYQFAAACTCTKLKTAHTAYNIRPKSMTLP